MTAQRSAPYGSWKSPITSELYASSYIGLSEAMFDNEEIYWNELRPKEAGRNLIVHLTSDGKLVEVTPSSFNARTRVHEYGGGDYLVKNGTVYFSNFTDQRLYRQRLGSEPEPVTPAVDLRYADGVIDERRNKLVAVREDHTTGAPQVVTTLVSIDLAGGGPGDVIASGYDFYSNPRISPDGSKLAWLSWNHPNMPWDGTELWVGEIGQDGL